METRQVLIQNTGGLGDESGASDPEAVTAGNLAAFDGEGNAQTLYDATASNIDDITALERILFVQGNDDKSIRTSPLLVDNITSVEKRAYVAPTKHKVVLSSIPTGEDATYTLRVVLEDELPWTRVTAQAEVDSGDTAAEIAQALADAVNDIDRLDVTASVVNTNELQLEADDEEVVFHIGRDGGLEDATETVTEPTYGSGTGEELLELEKAAWPGYGEYYVDDGLLGRKEDPEQFAAADGQYTYYVIRHQNDQEDSINRAFRHQQIILAVESAVTGDLDTFFGDLLNS